MPNCKKIDKCPKVQMVLDKDLMGYAEAIRAVCKKCEEVKLNE